jgi:SAM-dependent methyltransferase/MoaA/NifB/PqqE/SkfB family radical SAM enzyme
MQFTKKSRSAFLNFLRSKYSRLNGNLITNSLPYHILIDPSSCCQLRCSMCMDPTDPNRRIRNSTLMSPELYASLLDELGDNLFMISLYNWGEPLLNPHLSEFIELAKQHDIFVDINTNLALELTDNDLITLLRSGVDNIVVSIDGFSQATYGKYRLGGSFDQARRNITRLTMLRDQLALSTAITWKFLVFSFNEHEIAQAERYCQNFGITFARKEAIINVEAHPEWLPSYRQSDLERPNGGWPFTRSMAPDLKAAGREATCAWHYCYTSINADGSVSPCCAVADVKDDFGTVIPGKRTFADIWNGELFRKSRAVMAGHEAKELDILNPVCLHCAFPFLKDLSTGIDQFITARFREVYGASEPVLAAAFDRLSTGNGFKEYIEATPATLNDHSPVREKDSSIGSKDKVVPAHSEKLTTPSEMVTCGHGICSVCGADTEFTVKKAGFSLRETICGSCGASRRSRDLVTGILKTYGLDALGSLTDQLSGLTHLTIFEAQAEGPLHRVLRQLPDYRCAEFFDGIPLGSTNAAGVRCEDLERLTFADDSLDLVITQDVFEHVADPQAAFREIARVLKPGGCHIFTVPLHEGHNTLTRVEVINGQPVHLMPPVYHGDPLRATGSLVYTDFGNDLPDLLVPLGFATDIISQELFYTSEELPWIDNETSHTYYLQCRQRGELLVCLRYNSVVFRSNKLREGVHPVTDCSSTNIQSTSEAWESTQMSQPDSIMTAFERVIELFRHEEVPASLHVKAGEICYTINRLDMAHDLFRLASDRQPDCGEAINNLGVTAFHSGDYPTAEQHFYKALSVNPANWDARRNLADLYRCVPQLAERADAHFVYCPCCNGNFPGFIAGGPNLRPNAYCPRCGSLERHRLLWLYLKERTNFFTDRLKVLHIAPEKIYQDAFQALPNLDYVSADISSPLAMIMMDITDIPFDEKMFDVIICSHVLEHVPDDRKAMRELYRVLKPDGWGILQVPIDMNRDATFEDPTISDPAERQRLFGQDDHVRWYGRDYAERLKESGFNVSIEPFAREMAPDNVHRMGIISTEDIYRCSKQTVKHCQNIEPPIPPDKLRFMNETPEQFLEIGTALLKELQDYAGLTMTGRMLDIGSGDGRIAHAIIRSSKFHGEYTGIDNLANHIAWCQQNLTPINPRIRFEHLDIINDRYNPRGVIDPKSFVFPFGNAEFDVICLTSVFTHMYEDDIRRYLMEIRRMLAPHGTCYATFFIVDETCRQLLQTGKGTIPMPHTLNNHTFYHNQKDPLHAISFEGKWLNSFINSTGFSIRDIRYGTWCGRNVPNMYQDVVILQQN